VAEDDAMNLQFLGAERASVDELFELHLSDDGGGVVLSLPKAGLEEIFGRPLSREDIETVLGAHVKELVPLIDRAHARCGSYTHAQWPNGTGYRRLDVTMSDIRESGLKLVPSVLDT
jgi:hypothetical protein